MRCLVLVLVLSACATSPKRIVVSPQADNNLGFLYSGIPVEFAFCAYGQETKELVWVKRIDLPMILKATPDLVWYGECSGRDFLGYGHSHLEPPCALSETDVESWQVMKPKYAFLLCGNRLLWWRKK